MVDIIHDSGPAASRGADGSGPVPDSSVPDSGVMVLDRCMTLLSLLAAGPQTPRQLAAASGVPRPTTHRLLVALEKHRLVTRDDGGTFRLGARLTELAAVAGPELDLASVAGPVLDQLHRATGESVQLYVRSDGHRLCIAARDSGTGLRDSVPVGALLPLAAGSGGKILLAWSAEADAADAGLAEVRARGWAESVAEREPGVASVSAPVFAAGELLAALCVSGPESRLGQAPGDTLSEAVVAAASALTALLSAS